MDIVESLLLFFSLQKACYSYTHRLSLPLLFHVSSFSIVWLCPRHRKLPMRQTRNLTVLLENLHKVNSSLGLLGHVGWRGFDAGLFTLYRTVCVCIYWVGKGIFPILSITLTCARICYATLCGGGGTAPRSQKPNVGLKRCKLSEFPRYCMLSRSINDHGHVCGGGICQVWFPTCVTAWLAVSGSGHGMMRWPKKIGLFGFGCARECTHD